MSDGDDGGRLRETEAGEGARGPGTGGSEADRAAEGRTGSGGSVERPRDAREEPTPEGSTAGPGDTPRPDDEVFYCDLCGNVMLNLHCKLICERCGYKRDCSDP